MQPGKTKTGLFLLIAIVVFFPMLQHCFSFYATKALNGAVTNAGDVAFTLQGWWDGTYQEQKNKYLNDNVGGRPDLVRVNNEIDFRLFNVLHANGVIAGKDGYLFEDGYIDEYTGANFEVDNKIRKELIKLKRIQDTLERMGKTFVFVEAPSKAYYYPDKFPDGSRFSLFKGKSNYRSHVLLCDSLHIKHIDMNAWFAGQRGKADEHKLFSKLGTHWTFYGALLASDSLTRYIAKQRNIRLPALVIKRMYHSDTPRSSDADIALGVNLVSRFRNEKLCYPEFEYVADGNDTAKPKIIMIGDSFIWPIHDNGLLKEISRDGEYWYYFKEMLRLDTASGKYVATNIDSYDWRSSLLQADCIVALFSPLNIKMFHYPGTTIELLYDFLFPGQQ